MLTMKKGLLLILIMALALSAVSAGAVTDKTIGEYENIVSTYSIDKSIPSYEQLSPKGKAIADIVGVWRATREAAGTEQEMQE